jgi:glycosyltransferase involved in cell wall biosynthesis
MKILFDHHTPFAYAHGGAQIQIEQTKLALEKCGVEVEMLRWWDDAQRGDIVHYFGRAPAFHIHCAHQKGMKFVMAELLTGQGSRSLAQLRLQRLITRLIKCMVPGTFTGAFNWESYCAADAFVALTGWEARLMRMLFDAPSGQIHVVPNGVEQEFFDASPRQRGKWLVCTATVVGRKRVLELARAAIQARTPVWVIGKPYSLNDPYFQEFTDVAKQNPQWIRYEGAIEGRAAMAGVYREARGFVLLSAKESLSLSVLEAVACECPLLLSDLPSARFSFGDAASYCPITSKTSITAGKLRAFYDCAPDHLLAPKPLTWREVGRQLMEVYASLLRQPDSA